MSEYVPAPYLSPLSQNGVAVGNVGAGPDDLMTYTLPRFGNGFRVRAWGSTLSNANAKTLTFQYGATGVIGYGMATFNVILWAVDIYVIRTGANTQKFTSTLTAINSAAAAIVDIEQGTGAENESAAMIIKGVATICTTNNDIVQEGMIVWAL